MQIYLAQSSLGRVLLHLACACHDHKYRWHWLGIRRELARNDAEAINVDHRKSAASIAATLVLTSLIGPAFAQEASIPDPGLNAAIHEALQIPDGPLSPGSPADSTATGNGGI
jgi:hypothetical protein